MIICVEDALVCIIDYYNPTVRNFSACLPRIEFFRKYAVPDDSNIRVLNYEPEQSLYAVTTELGVTKYNDPVEHPILSIIHSKADEILATELLEKVRLNRPSDYHTFNDELMVWEITDQNNFKYKKQQKISTVHQLRDQKETEGFNHAGFRFQSDERSVARIGNAAQTAMGLVMQGQNPDFPDWKTEDNQPFPVTAQGMMALQASLTQHAGALHVYSRALEDQIAAAETQEALDAININAGWPV